MESYVTRLTHEKYAATYHKVVNSLRNMFHAKPDSPTLLNFVALVKWAGPDAVNKLCADVGMPCGPVACKTRRGRLAALAGTSSQIPITDTGSDNRAALPHLSPLIARLLPNGEMK